MLSDHPHRSDDAANAAPTTPSAHQGNDLQTPPAQPNARDQGLAARLRQAIPAWGQLSLPIAAGATVIAAAGTAATAALGEMTTRSFQQDRTTEGLRHDSDTLIGATFLGIGTLLSASVAAGSALRALSNWRLEKAARAEPRAALEQAMIDAENEIGAALAAATTLVDCARNAYRDARAAGAADAPALGDKMHELEIVQGKMRDATALISREIGRLNAVLQDDQAAPEELFKQYKEFISLAAKNQTDTARQLHRYSPGALQSLSDAVWLRTGFYAEHSRHTADVDGGYMQPAGDIEMGIVRS